MDRRQFITNAAAVAAAAPVASVGVAQAQTSWPDKPVRVVLPYAPGGATDAIGRPWADELSKAMGQAKTLIFHGRVYSVSTTGRVIFKVSQNSFSGIAPRDDGTSVSTSGTTTYTAAGVISFAVTADTMFNVECTAEVDDTGAASTQSVEFSLDVTMIEA